MNCCLGESFEVAVVGGPDPFSMILCVVDLLRCEALGAVEEEEEPSHAVRCLNQVRLRCCQLH